MGADPASVAFDTVQSGLSRGTDVIIIDTAGRLHNKAHLMEELSKIKRVMKKLIPDAPHEVLLVLDGSTGQNALEQAKHFTAATDVTALAITKLDGTAKGGVVLAIANQFKIPVKYIGVGEKIEDLLVFDSHEFVDSLFKVNRFLRSSVFRRSGFQNDPSQDSGQYRSNQHSHFGTLNQFRIRIRMPDC